jgi:microcystin-dependent protein
MSDPYLSMIEAFGFNFAPVGWAMCAGQTLSIAQNQALFSLLGTTYGGNGTTTFNLPDLRGRLAVGFGQGLGLSSFPLGAAGGQEAHQLLAGEAPSHTHTLNATNNGQANGTNVPRAPACGWAAATASKPTTRLKTSTAMPRRRWRWRPMLSAPRGTGCRTKTGWRF